MINLSAIEAASKGWIERAPFPHLIVDNFFEEDVARRLESEFPEFEDSIWHEYGNAIEVKKVCNNWNAFPESTYKVFSHLNSPQFVDFLSKVLFGALKLFSDPGLNGGGWHIHARGGKLNTHLDYSLHPKLGMQRKLNIIVYLNSDWREEWGGNLGFWGNKDSAAPGGLVKEVVPKFNRAVIFDTTKNSWHGLPNPLECPPSQCRKSLAVYYLVSAESNVDPRAKALFAPAADQANDAEVLDLIKKRASVEMASEVYKKR